MSISPLAQTSPRTDAVADNANPPAAISNRWEWPTWAVAVASYGLWIGLTLLHEHIPLWLLILVGGGTVCWQGSLQHETIHGHPTRSARIDRLLGYAPLSLWMPYDRYATLHTTHHRSALTDPSSDPESFYVPARRWKQMSTPARKLHRVCHTLAGRLLIGPAMAAVQYWRGELGAIRGGDNALRAVWWQHLLAVTLLMLWVVAVCDMPVWKYIVAFAYPGLALTLLRSFAEHHYDRDPERRTAVVRGGRMSSLLYLNNNLHVVHHDQPAVAWYRLPRIDRTRQQPYPGPVYPGGYRELARRFLFHPIDSPRYPGSVSG